MDRVLPVLRETASKSVPASTPAFTPMEKASASSGCSESVM